MLVVHNVSSSQRHKHRTGLREHAATLSDLSCTVHTAPSATFSCTLRRCLYCVVNCSAASAAQSAAGKFNLVQLIHFIMIAFTCRHCCQNNVQTCAGSQRLRLLRESAFFPLVNTSRHSLSSSFSRSATRFQPQRRGEASSSIQAPLCLSFSASQAAFKRE